MAFNLIRVDRFLPIQQVEICFLRLMPGFPSESKNFKHYQLNPRMVHKISQSLISGRHKFSLEWENTQFSPPHFEQHSMICPDQPPSTFVEVLRAAGREPVRNNPS
jgi:hypothetical protein